MNRVWLFLCFLCIPWAARGQSAYEWRYWFDDAKSQQQTGQGSGAAFNFTADAAALDEGLHTIHVQIADTAGRFSPPQSQLFFRVGDRTVKQLRYWFDTDREAIETVPITANQAILDANNLEPGLHFIYCQTEDVMGNVSDVESRIFYRTMRTDMANWSYWFDDDHEARHTAPRPDGPVLIDVSDLADGFHIIYQQVSEKTPSAVESRWFIKIPQTVGSADMTCICTVDEKMVGQQRVPANGGIISWDLDVNALPVGLHRAVFQVITATGAASTIAERFFVRAITPTEVGKMQCVYTLDNSDTQSQAGTMANGLFHFDLDVSQLEDGLHRIAYMLLAEDGTATPQQTAFFWKTPLGGNGIVQYDYWLNDEEQAMRSIHLDKRENPFKLISLLPVDAQPLRSKCFHFEVKNGQPMIYAKNDFHIRFYDTAGRCLNDSRQFVDYQVAQEVTDIETLEPGITATTEKPEENVIKWYSLEAEPGDSVQFKLDHAATIQLFAPSGQEVHSVSGSESVKWNGLHVRESGTYYLALHDVTATQGTTVSIDYNHIDKYAVLRQDVAVVGNGGCSTITFEGNGFRDLYAVDLYNEQGDTIKHILIGHESDVTTSVAFDFTGVALGDYHAKFHFTEEIKEFTKLVIVEEAVDIKLATTISFPPTFPHGRSTTYTVKITNRGNMTAYSVPIYTWIMNKWKKDGIYHIKYDGLDLPGIFDGVDMSSMPESDRAELQALSESIGDSHYFLLLRTVDEESPTDSVWVRSNYFFTNIAPHETKTLRLTISADEGVWAYFTVPEDWFSISSEQEKNNIRYARTPSKLPSLNDLRNKYCCIRSKVECIASITADVAGIASQITGIAAHGTPVDMAFSVASCAANAINRIITATGDVMCGKNEVASNLLETAKAIANGLSIANELSSCASNLFGAGKVKAILEAIATIADGGGFVSGFNIAADLDGCKKAFTESIPGCPPSPPGGGGSGGGLSWDPNDIYGYLSESGSKYIADSVAMVNYTIEFENDATLATLPAHTIVVKDTLDSRYFDLKTFLPTSIKIGERETFLDETKDVKFENDVISFVKTIDMRPEINAIAQVEGTYDESKGIAKWHVTSLDPMTMEPTDDVMQGVLPVNTNGQGIGEVSYDIKLKDGLAHGTEVNNRASIVFDTNEPIMTPTWTNVIDRIAPESHIDDVQMATDSTATVRIEATDDLSGPWRYDVYVQYGSGAWFLEAENVPIDTTASVKVYEGINHGFYVVVTDSAGNVEQKEAAREYTFEVFAPQVDTNTKLQLAQGWNWVSHNQQEALSAEALKPKAQRIVSQTDELYKDSRFGWMGTLDELLPTQMYKVQMAEADEVQLSGRLFNAAFRAVPLYAGWNWIGYPVAQTMTPAEALQKIEAEEDDAIIGRDGLATYSDGEWTGTLAEMVPGQGYMYRSTSDKSLFLNATAQASSRAVHRSRTMADGQWPEDWTVDRQRYPNVMGMVAELWQDGKPVEDSGEWLLGAFSGGECRGLAETVGSHLMMNVYGRGGEKIEFFVMHRESGEILTVSESEEFRADLLGTVRQPYQLNMGVLTGIRDATRLNNNEQINNNWYDLQGRRLSVSSASSENSVLPKGVYIVTDGQKKGTQKVVRR